MPQTVHKTRAAKTARTEGTGTSAIPVVVCPRLDIEVGSNLFTTTVTLLLKSPVFRQVGFCSAGKKRINLVSQCLCHRFLRLSALRLLFDGSGRS